MENSNTSLSPREIGRAISDYFHENRITLKEAAERLGYSTPQVVANYISGRKFGHKVAARFAEAFGFNSDFLLKGLGELQGDSELAYLRKQNEQFREIIKSQAKTIEMLTELKKQKRG